MACYNSMVPYVCPDLPAAEGSTGLRRKNAAGVLSRRHSHWTSFQKLGVFKSRPPNVITPTPRSIFP